MSFGRHVGDDGVHGFHLLKSTISIEFKVVIYELKISNFFHIKFLNFVTYESKQENSCMSICKLSLLFKFHVYLSSPNERLPKILNWVSLLYQLEIHELE